MKKRGLMGLVTAGLLLGLLLPAGVPVMADESDAQVQELYADQDTDVGEVRVWNDTDNLYVKYVIDVEGWLLTEYHLDVVCDMGDFPTTRKGNPKVGKFTYGGPLPYVDEYTEVIDLDDIDCTSVFIAANAVVATAADDCWEQVWQIGEVEVFDEEAGFYTNWADEFNWGDPAGPLTAGPGLAVEQPPYADPFVVGLTPTEEFPFNSNASYPPGDGYATDFDVQWDGCLPFGGMLTFSWSPGKSAMETKRVTVDALAPAQFSAQGQYLPGQGLFLDSPVVENTMPIDEVDCGLHTIRFEQLEGDGTAWDWILLEKRCEETETAWADGTRFVNRGNWATYFSYEMVPVPELFDGLVLWLDAGAIEGLEDGDAVEAWDDLTDGGNDATQASAAKQPTYVASGLNAMPVVRFGGGEKFLRHDAILSSEYTAIYVLKLGQSAVNLLYYYHAGDVSAHDLGFFAECHNQTEGWGSVALPDVRTSSDYPTPLEWALHTHTPEALYQNGSEVDYARSGDVCGGGLTDIGSRSDHAGLYFVGDIAEILIYETVLDDAEREAVEDYLRSKWDLA